MKLTLMANIENHGDAGCVAWIEGIKGLVVQAKNHEDAYRELITSVKVKLAFDWGIPAANLVELNEGEAKRLQREHDFKKELDKPCRHEINISGKPAAVAC